MNIPAHFAARMKELLGDKEYADFLASYDDARLYGMRVNTSKITCGEFEKICPFEIKRIPWIPNGYYYNGDEVQPAKHPYYHAGLYYLQEPSAMTPASRLPVEPGDAVLDLCAAPGGKATELGARLKGNGVLVANDVSASRARALLKNIELFGIGNTFIVSETPDRLSGYFEGFFDKILMDAPCSGEGMFRKDPAVMRAYEQNGVEFYAKLQREIIIPAVRMLKPGGYMLYSTCTFSPEEDEQAVEFLLGNCPDMELVDMEGYGGFDYGRPEWGTTGNESLKKCVRIWPHRMNGEGHFLAMFRKSGNEAVGAKAKPKARKVHKQAASLEYFFEFAKDLDYKIDETRLELQGDRLFYMADGMQGLKGMRFLRNGLYLGDCLKGRFEPSQSLAMAIGRGRFKKTVSLPADDERVRRYLKGETIMLTEKEAVYKGWTLLCVDGFPLGWGKCTGSSFKNKYHSGWRLM